MSFAVGTPAGVDGPPCPTSPGPSTPAGWAPPPWYGLHPAVYNGPGSLAYQAYDPALATSPPAGGPAWSGYAGPIASSIPPSAPPSSTASPNAAGPVAIKQEVQSFLSQPMHGYVTGDDCAVVPAGEQRKPPCGCANKHGPHYHPGPHATWDCPHRYIARFGFCPGFLPTGFRDASQWNGPNLSRAAKAAWVKLITDKDLPLPDRKSVV